MHVSSESAQALHTFYQNIQKQEAYQALSSNEKKQEKPPGRVLLKIETNKIGEKYLVAKKESDVGLLNRFLSIFGVGRCALRKVVELLNEEQDQIAGKLQDKSITIQEMPKDESTQLSNIINKKVSHYNKKWLHRQKASEFTFKHITEKPEELPSIGKTPLETAEPTSETDTTSTSEERSVGIKKKFQELFHHLDEKNFPVISEKRERELIDSFTALKRDIEGEDDTYKALTTTIEAELTARKEKLTTLQPGVTYRDMIIEQRGDGNCFLYSFIQGMRDLRKKEVSKLSDKGHQFYNDLMTHPELATHETGMHKDLRSQVVQYMEEHDKDPNTLSQIIGGIEEYNADMKKSIDFQQEHELEGLKELYQEANNLYETAKTECLERYTEQHQKGIISTDEPGHVEKYIKLSRNNGFYCASPHIQALATIFQVNIAVFEISDNPNIPGQRELMLNPNKSIIHLEKEGETVVVKRPTIEVVYTGNHFDGKRPTLSNEDLLIAALNQDLRKAVKKAKELEAYSKDLGVQEQLESLKTDLIWLNFQEKKLEEFNNARDKLVSSYRDILENIEQHNRISKSDATPEQKAVLQKEIMSSIQATIEDIQGGIQELKGQL